MNLLKLLNYFMLMHEGNLTEIYHFFFNKKLFIRDQNHQIISKNIYNLFIGG